MLKYVSYPFVLITAILLVSGCQRDLPTPEAPEEAPASSPPQAGTTPEVASSDARSELEAETETQAPEEERPVLDADGLPVSWVNPAPDEIKKHTFERSPLAPLVSVGEDGALDYKPYSPKGDRIPDF